MFISIYSTHVSAFVFYMLSKELVNVLCNNLYINARLEDHVST